MSTSQQAPQPFLLPVILAGGSGTRLWPLSREAFPKQFLTLGESHSLLQRSLTRLQGLPALGDPVVLTQDAHRFLVAEQLRALGAAGPASSTVVLEPAGRNTAPAALVAARLAIQAGGSDAQVLILSADHVMADSAAFHAAVARARHLAAQGWFTTFGIRPSRAETGYGYLERGAALGEHGFTVSRFVEKPDAVTAQTYVDGGQHAWNGGMFLLPAQALLDAANALEPDMLGHCESAVSEAARDLDFLRLGAAFKSARDISIDYAFMERVSRVAMVELDAGWDDVGAWRYLTTLPGDAHGNRQYGDVRLHDCRNTRVHADSRLVAAVGVEDLLIIESEDAVLVTTPDAAQDVRQIVQQLKQEGHASATHHPVVHRPWGSYETLVSGPRYQVKRIIVKPGQKLSLQLHHHRAEHWIVVTGTAVVTCNDDVQTLSENQSVYIPLGHRHRLENPGRIPLELIEVQSGSYLGEDDIVRFEDIYGRSPDS